MTSPELAQIFTVKYESDIALDNQPTSANLSTNKIREMGHLAV